MVFASACEHASSAFVFGSTSSDQVCHASSEHHKKDRWRAVSISKIFSRHLRQVDTVQPIPAV